MNSWSSKKPSLVTARACVLIFQDFQLFSFLVQFCGLSRLPCPCRPESRKRNTYEPASVSCSLCRSTLPCRQVRRVTNIYVLSFCVSSLSSFCILSNSSISVLLAGRTAFYYCVLPLHSQDNGRVASLQRSSSGRHRKSSNSSHIHPNL